MRILAFLALLSGFLLASCGTGADGARTSPDAAGRIVGTPGQNPPTLRNPDGVVTDSTDTSPYTTEMEGAGTGGLP